MSHTIQCADCEELVSTDHTYCPNCGTVLWDGYAGGEIHR